MKIFDNNNMIIAVTDLDAAIARCAEFMGYSHDDESFREFDRKQHEYWKDLYTKLIHLKSEKQ